jgi:hypothetical protein
MQAVNVPPSATPSTMVDLRPHVRFQLRPQLLTRVSPLLKGRDISRSPTITAIRWKPSQETFDRYLGQLTHLVAESPTFPPDAPTNPSSGLRVKASCASRETSSMSSRRICRFQISRLLIATKSAHMLQTSTRRDDMLNTGDPRNHTKHLLGQTIMWLGLMSVVVLLSDFWGWPAPSA